VLQGPPAIRGAGWSGSLCQGAHTGALSIYLCRHAAVVNMPIPMHRWDGEVMTMGDAQPADQMWASPRPRHGRGPPLVHHRRRSAESAATTSGRSRGPEHSRRRSSQEEPATASHGGYTDLALTWSPASRGGIHYGHPWTGVGPIPHCAWRTGSPCHARDPPPNSGVHKHALKRLNKLLDVCRDPCGWRTCVLSPRADAAATSGTGLASMRSRGLAALAASGVWAL